MIQLGSLDVAPLWADTFASTLDDLANAAVALDVLWTICPDDAGPADVARAAAILAGHPSEAPQPDARDTADTPESRAELCRALLGLLGDDELTEALASPARAVGLALATAPIVIDDALLFLREARVAHATRG